MHSSAGLNMNKTGRHKGNPKGVDETHPCRRHRDKIVYWTVKVPETQILIFFSYRSLIRAAQLT